MTVPKQKLWRRPHRKAITLMMVLPLVGFSLYSVSSFGSTPTLGQPIIISSSQVSTRTRREDIPQHLRFDSMTHSVLKKHQEEVVIAMISFGNATKTKLVERFVWSLRTNGDWRGRIFLITDNAAYYREQFQDHVDVAQARPEDLHPRYKHNDTLVPFTRDVMRFKRFKTLVFDYAEEVLLPPAYKLMTHILYLDIDMIAARPISIFLQDYFEQMSRIRDDAEKEQSDAFDETRKKKTKSKSHVSTSQAYMSMFSDCATCAKQITNGGCMMLSKTHSKACLEQWKNEFDTKPRGRLDQSLLRHVKDNGLCKLHVLPDRHRLYPTWKDMRLKQSATFVHNTNTYGALKIPAKVQKDYYEWILNTTLFSENETF